MEKNNGDNNYKQYEKDLALYMHTQISFIVD